MAKRIYLEENYLVIAEALDLTDDKYNLVSNIYIEKNGSLFIFYRLSDNHLIESIYFADILDGDGVAYESLEDFTALMLEKTGKPSSIDVNIQDQYTPTLILPMALELGMTTTTANTVIDEYTITVSDPTEFIIGRHFRIINSNADRYYFGTILDVVGNLITVDTPFDFIYSAGSEATSSSINMNVNGSVTPVTFVLRTGSPSIPSAVDVTRIIITCITDTSIDLGKFGDLPALTRGIVFRRVDGVIQNIFNAKSNADIANIAYDFTVYDATNPSQGVDGFVSRLTFAGQNKIGVVLRIGQNDNLEMIIQDDLTGLLKLSVILEGHVVED